MTASRGEGERPEVTAAWIRGSDQGYVAYHAPRFAYLLRLLSSLGAGPDSRVLDIGLSRLTELVRERLGAQVDSLGLQPDSIDQEGRHYRFDLNLAQEESTWRRDLPTYDFVVMAEVLEHLYTAPELVLVFVSGLLKQGGRLILQTPNATSLPKRIKLLLGRNPYERIRVDRDNPGHFREYTLSELRALAEDLGLEEDRCRRSFYFDARYGRHAGDGAGRQRWVGGLKNVLYRSLPPSLREGITLVWRKA